MKVIIGIMFSSAVVLASCSSPKGDKVNAGDAVDLAGKDTTAIVYTVVADKSSIAWVGSKPLGQHNGTIAIKSGEIDVKDGVITGGAIVIDMKTIKDLDLADKAANEKLTGHLMSPDFFDVEKYPEAKFEIQKIENVNHKDVSHLITGNLTLKDVTKSITFKVNIKFAEDKMIASAPSFIIDRTDWNIIYGSKKFVDNLKDKFINDEIILEIKTLVAVKQEIR